MDYKNILVAVDLSESSNILIRKAIAIAEINQAQLSFVFVDLQFPINNSDLAYNEFEFPTIEPDLKSNNLHREKLQELADNTDYEISNVIYLTGDVAKMLEIEVKELGADLLICGHHHHHFWNNYLSSVHKIVNATTTDLFIVQV